MKVKNFNRLICKIDLNTKKPVAVFNTYIEACRDIGLSDNSTANIQRACTIYGWCKEDGRFYTKGNVIRNFGYCFLEDANSFEVRPPVTVTPEQAAEIEYLTGHIADDHDRSVAQGKLMYRYNGIILDKKKK